MTQTIKKTMEKGMERLGVATIMHKDIYNTNTQKSNTKMETKVGNLNIINNHAP